MEVRSFFEKHLPSYSGQLKENEKTSFIGEGTFGKVYRVRKAQKNEVHKIYVALGGEQYIELSHYFKIPQQESMILNFLRSIFKDHGVGINVPKILKISKGNELNLMPDINRIETFYRESSYKMEKFSPSIVFEDIKGVSLFSFLANREIPFAVRVRYAEIVNREILKVKQVIMNDDNNFSISGSFFHQEYAFDEGFPDEEIVIFELRDITESLLKGGKMEFGLGWDNFVVGVDGELFLVDPI